MGKVRSVLKDSSYLKHTYSNKIAPIGSYPDMLSEWLLEKVYATTGRILDVGCGRGDFLYTFSRLGFEPCGLDISPNVEELFDYDVRQINFEEDELPFEKESFDFVFSKSVIEHIQDPHNFLKATHDSLKAGGKAAIMTPSWEYTYWGPFYVDNTHVSPYTSYSLKAALEMQGFKNVKVMYFYQLPFLWKFPWLKVFVKMIAKLPIPYSPYNDVPWKTSRWLNKLVRFSKEVMLLAVAEK